MMNDLSRMNSPKKRRYKKVDLFKSLGGGLEVKYILKYEYNKIINIGV